MQCLPDCAPVTFPQQNSVAPLPNDQQRLVGLPHLANQGVEPLAGFSG